MLIDSFLPISDTLLVESLAQLVALAPVGHDDFAFHSLVFKFVFDAIYYWFCWKSRLEIAEYYDTSIDYLVGLTEDKTPYPRKRLKS